MRASLWPSCCPLSVVVFVIRHTKRNKTRNIYFAFLMLNYLWYICRAFFFAMFAAIGLPLSLSSLFLFFWLYFMVVFFSLLLRYFLLCCLCILFILIWQVGAFVCLKKLEMMFEFCAIVCHINCMMRYFCYLPVCC